MVGAYEAKARNSLCQRNMAGAEGIEKVYGIFASFVYAARTATAARAFCPLLPVTAHGHCPANYDILGMARQ